MWRLSSRGDIIIDGGNSFFQDTIRRARDIEAKGLLFLGTGVSGGEEGALHGPSVIPGGILPHGTPRERSCRDIAAKVDGEPCCVYIGPDGAGHYVKMVHNGIEYGDMQLISEAYFIMRNLLGMDNQEMARVFARWNQGDLDSYLIQITADILTKKDPETGLPLVEQILDKAGQKGTGKWTIQSALDLGVASATMAEAVFARTISAMKEERTQASKVLRGPSGGYSGDAGQLVEAVHDALYASKICSYAQGFSLMRAAAREYSWGLKFGEIASIWRGGCIIRARFLGRIREAYEKEPDLANLLLDPYFRQIVEKAQPGVASPCGGRGGTWSSHPGVFVRAFVFRLISLGEASREPDPGTAGLLRRPHVPAGGQTGDVPQRTGRSSEGVRSIARPGDVFGHEPGRVGEAFLLVGWEGEIEDPAHSFLPDDCGKAERRVPHAFELLSDSGDGQDPPSSRTIDSTRREAACAMA